MPQAERHKSWQLWSSTRCAFCPKSFSLKRHTFQVVKGAPTSNLLNKIVFGGFLSPLSTILFTQGQGRCFYLSCLSVRYRYCFLNPVLVTEALVDRQKVPSLIISTSESYLKQWTSLVTPWGFICFSKNWVSYIEIYCCLQVNCGLFFLTQLMRVFIAFKPVSQDWA